MNPKSYAVYDKKYCDERCEARFNRKTKTNNQDSRNNKGEKKLKI
jgi:hypothetical protein